jgi:hypothetical protein
LAEESQQAVLGVLSGAGVVQATGPGAGQSQGVIEFTVGEESGVTGDGGPVELQLDLAIKINAQATRPPPICTANRGAPRRAGPGTA